MTTAAVSKPQLVDDLLERGLIAQCSNPELLRDFLSSRQSLYCGFDPTAGSLHIGHLVPLLMLKRFQDAGHHVIALIGGATGFIGDPSFKATERSLNDTKSIQTWTEQLGCQIIALLQPVLSEPLQLVNNADWLSTLDVISFFRDVGKHFSVNAMMRKDSVRQRLERADQGISFTEFSYSLLQSFDFAMLNQRFGCTLQIGGNDQWGNIVAGIDLTRRLNHTKVEGLTLQLIFGYVFQPLAFILGVSWEEARLAGSFIGQKLVINEFVAYLDFVKYVQEGKLSEHTQIIVTFALCGFANFSSIAILLGGLGSMAPSRRPDIAQLGLKALFAATLANLMSAAIAGFFFSLS